ncbi:hypothetical protein AX774_g3451 [Zancudomyces culisetae]|uniref:Uncharacterized protein n=1 Tax=Zancudomyces culisetae TaxID=1213189 RepID=A0A1R1PQ16_ZANCU|nr:hypothetical protein AX774_g3451 [Zancudomyces culisetae]|eukprot:OMH83050.1 hypothetical protein AX774_g3451 [Zancudomyces culisetae]
MGLSMIDSGNGRNLKMNQHSPVFVEFKRRLWWAVFLRHQPVFKHLTEAEDVSEKKSGRRFFQTLQTFKYVER